MSTRIFLFTDIHANLPALEAIELAVQQESPDLVIHLGDAVDTGPHPTQVVSMLDGHADWLCLRGNHEEAVCGREREVVDLMRVEHRAWTCSQLQPKHFEVIHRWQFQWTVKFEGLSLCFQHYALMGDPGGGWFFRPVFMPEPALLDVYFHGGDYDMVFFGHLHHSVVVSSRTTQYYGVMAAGLGPTAEAAYSIVDIEAGQATVIHKSVLYDDQRLFSDMEALQVPAREFLYEAFFGGRFKPTR